MTWVLIKVACWMILVASWMFVLNKSGYELDFCDSWVASCGTFAMSKIDRILCRRLQADLFGVDPLFPG